MMDEIQFVTKMIQDEKVSGEFMISSGVQHAIMQLMIHFPTSLETEENILSGIDTVMYGLEESGVIWNEFLVGESVRGFIHGLVSVGLSPEEAVRISARGVMNHLRKRSFDLGAYEKSLVVGVRNAGEDMGVAASQLTQLISILSEPI